LTTSRIQRALKPVTAATSFKERPQMSSQIICQRERSTGSRAAR
jgi:hypothetical protein